MKNPAGDVPDLKSVIRNVKNFPKPGIVFRDITTLIADPRAMRYAVDKLAEETASRKAEVIVAAESRGFIFGSTVAYKLGLPLVLVRKPGKLPAKTVSQTYELEYGTDTLEIHADAIKRGQRVMLIDDLLATGGTIEACASLVQQLGGIVVGAAFVIGLSFIPKQGRLKNVPVYSIVDYESE
jgi:adenine phosphoribosyltransferase